METPHTKAGRLTEAIMRVFYEMKPGDVVLPRLETAQYNRIYSRVLYVLNTAGLDKEV